MLARLIVWIRPVLPAVCFVFLWSTVLLTVWSLFRNIRQGIANLRQLHRIPCADCEYATGSHLLKCSVQPFTAFSEEAIDCPDFEPAQANTQAPAGELRVNGL